MNPRKSTGSKRDSLASSLCPTSSKKSRRSSTLDEKHFSPTTLARKLEELRDSLPESVDSAVELKDFDIEGANGSLEDFTRRREEVRQKTANPDQFDPAGKAALNVEGAALAGARMIIDSERSTRSLSKKLHAECGISQEQVLYKGLPKKGSELQSAKQYKQTRDAALIESFVDFQKQIEFKINVLNHIENTQTDARKKALSQSEGRLTRGKQAAEKTKKKKKVTKKSKKDEMDGMRTPEEKGHMPDPLDDKRIYDKYASVIASDIMEESKKRRRTAPIPFNLHLCDSDGEE